MGRRSHLECRKEQTACREVIRRESVAVATQAEYARAAALIVQLQSDLDAIAAAEPGSFQRSRAITRFQDTYAALGRIRLGDRFDELDTL